MINYYFQILCNFLCWMISSWKNVKKQLILWLSKDSIMGVGFARIWKVRGWGRYVLTLDLKRDYKGIVNIIIMSYKFLISMHFKNLQVHIFFKNISYMNFKQYKGIISREIFLNISLKTIKIKFWNSCKKCFLKKYVLVNSWNALKSKICMTLL